MGSSAWLNTVLNTESQIIILHVTFGLMITKFPLINLHPGWCKQRNGSSKEIQTKDIRRNPQWSGARECEVWWTGRHSGQKVDSEKILLHTTDDENHGCCENWFCFILYFIMDAVRIGSDFVTMNLKVSDDWRLQYESFNGQNSWNLNRQKCTHFGSVTLLLFQWVVQENYRQVNCEVITWINNFVSMC